ncbi:activating transcription factor 7-interacting protein 2 isoform X1 [Epinephelus moara]|uniref:activating transcription factor 7-interacting protein 2 isoform X1 n=2 Tax=Epinephelus moara TaxID=300413 RepID=UPI00214EA866|nr:activating transcription factor 7-interacting protein 2 isoform X1 [Epinephelus moara]XP_049924539.1 activating transcription factor 7-interacting protein 2 isoform X1 [Epinephelus moara]XP_049924540.1 activating transcription factor 7-interacting protein 2 isoform X1 [Epinephelus moara]
MADAQDQAHGCKSSKRKAEKKVKPSTQPKRRGGTGTQRARVNIGVAFERWRELKERNGYGSDAEVAQRLLDVMKNSPSGPAPSNDSNTKMTFSQSELETLIEQEVDTVFKKRENKLQGLIGTIQQLDREVNYESSMQKLEAQINTITKRAEAAIAYITKTQKKGLLPSPVDNEIMREDSENETTEATSQTDRKSTDCMDKSGELFRMTETTIKALKKMHDDNEVLKAAIADLSEELPHPVLTPDGSPDCEELITSIKKEPENEQETKNNVVESKQREEPKAGRVNVEGLSTVNNNLVTALHTDSEQDKYLYPPLPSTTFPSILSMEAASYNIPQRPKVLLALIRNPPGLSVMWDVEEKDPSEPPMKSYSIFMTMEKQKGNGVFRDWTTLGEVPANPLPMCVMVSKYKPGHKVCVAVIGKDKFGRYGPYSKVETRAIPD